MNHKEELQVKANILLGLQQRKIDLANVIAGGRQLMAHIELEKKNQVLTATVIDEKGNEKPVYSNDDHRRNAVSNLLNTDEEYQALKMDIEESELELQKNGIEQEYERRQWDILMMDWRAAIAMTPATVE